MGIPIKKSTPNYRASPEIWGDFPDKVDNKPPTFQSTQYKTQMKRSSKIGDPFWGDASKRFGSAPLFFPIRVWPNDPTIDYKILLIETKGTWKMPTIKSEGEPFFIPLHSKDPVPATPTPSDDPGDLFGDVFGDSFDDPDDLFGDVFGDFSDDPDDLFGDAFGDSFDDPASSLDNAFADAFDDPVPSSDHLFEDKSPSPTKPPSSLDDPFGDE